MPVPLTAAAALSMCDQASGLLTVLSSAFPGVLHLHAAQTNSDVSKLAAQRTAKILVGRRAYLACCAAVSVNARAHMEAEVKTKATNQ